LGTIWKPKSVLFAFPLGQAVQDPITSTVWGRIDRSSLDADTAQALQAKFGPGIFAPRGKGAPIDVLTEELNSTGNPVPEGYGGDPLASYLLDRGRSAKDVRADLADQARAEAARMASGGGAGGDSQRYVQFRPGDGYAPEYASVGGYGDARDDVPFSLAYHGSPERFDKFTTDKMGSGEGAQDFGWGMYFSGDKGVADTYRRWLSKEKNTGSGQLYKVKIPDDHELLDWNKTLREQSPAVLKGLSRIKEALTKRNPGVLDDLGGDWRLLLGKDVKGSDLYGTTTVRLRAYKKVQNLLGLCYGCVAQHPSTKGDFGRGLS